MIGICRIAGSQSRAITISEMAGYSQAPRQPMQACTRLVAGVSGVESTDASRPSIVGLVLLGHRQQEGGMDRLEPEPFHLLDPPADRPRSRPAPRRRALECLMGRCQAVDRRDVDRQAAARAEPMVARCSGPGSTWRPVPPTKMASGSGSPASTSGARPSTGRMLGTPNASALAWIEGDVGRLGLDGIDHPMYASCAASIATEPDPAPMSQTMLVARMSSWARAMARTSACVIRPRLGWVWAKASSALPKRRYRLARLARSGRFGLRTRISTLRGSNSIAGQVGELGLRDPLVGRAQVLADVGPEVVDSPIQQLPGQPGRRQLVAGEKADFLGRPDPIDDRFEGPARQVGQIGVLPAFLHPGEGQLHAADVRQDLEESLPRRSQR